MADLGLTCISKTRYHKRESFNFCELVKKGCLKRKLSRIACWCHQKLSHYQISRRKLSQIATKFVNFSSLKVSCYTLYARLSMADKPGCSKTMEEAASSNSTLMLYQQQLLAPALKQHSLKFTTTMSYIHQLVAISLTGGHPWRSYESKGHCVQWPLVPSQWTWLHTKLYSMLF